MQPTIALEIIRNRQHSRQQELFNEIYAACYESFLKWIMNRFNNHRHKDKLLEDAKDAFQNGVIIFYQKSQQKDFVIRGSLKTTIFSFALLQLLALFKKEKNKYISDNDLQYFNLSFEDEIVETEKKVLIDKRENDLLAALHQLPQKQRHILMLKFFGKLKSKQIAEKLDVTVGNIDNDSTKAYKTLRNILKDKFSFQSYCS